LTSTLSGEIRAILGGGAEEDRVAVSHFVVGAAFLVLGSLLSVVSFVTLRFPEIPLSFGRLEPVVNLILILGFGVVSLLGGVYYVLPRLTGARLWNPRVAALGLVGMAGLVVLGSAVVLVGWGSGRYPFGLPWWLDVPMVAVLAVPFLVTMRTLAGREEKYSYVTIWFVIGGVTWLPLLYAAHAAGHAPFISSVARAYNDMFLTAGLITMVIFVLGSGLFYYTTVRELDVPLANRSLAQVGFWSLGFASVWWGVAQLTFGPGPAWLAGVAAALGLAFPIGAVANAANGAMTLEGSWGELESRPGVRSGILGLFLGAGVAVLAALGGFRSLGARCVADHLLEGDRVRRGGRGGRPPGRRCRISALPRLVGRDIPDRRARLASSA
jgi:cbb3-type cytochrome oxidase subunit 1